MKAGQWIYYLCREVDIDWANEYAVCNLPSLGFFQIKNSPHILMMAS